MISETPLDIKVEGILRKHLDLSRSMFESLIDSGSLVCISGHNLKKCKIKDEIIIELRPE